MAAIFLLVDFENRRPAYLQLRDQIVQGIATAALAPGDPLPSVRRLASELGLNLHTVNKAFNVLRDEGFIRLTERQSATVDPKQEDAASAEQRLTAALTPLLAEFVVKGLSREAVMAQVAHVLEPIHTPAPTVQNPARSFHWPASEGPSPQDPSDHHKEVQTP